MHTGTHTGRHLARGSLVVDDYCSTNSSSITITSISKNTVPFTKLYPNHNRTGSNNGIATHTNCTASTFDLEYNCLYSTIVL